MTTINHVIDPTYFYDAIEEFAFDYTCYVVVGKDINDYGKVVTSYSTQTIRGSLQTEGVSLSQNHTGNLYDLKYNFYCKSLYRINIGDIIYYNGNYLRTISVHDYDEYGVRECKLEMIQLSAYRDLADYIKFINGEEIV